MHNFELHFSYVKNYFIAMRKYYEKNDPISLLS